jgi:hypothetical protein
MEKTKRVSRRVFCKFLIGFMFAPKLYAKQNQFSQIAPGKKQLVQKESNDILVLYYSLTRNTEIMAKALASHYQADLVGIVAEEYRNDFTGRTLASVDASLATAWEPAPATPMLGVPNSLM